MAKRLLASMVLAFCALAATGAPARAQERVVVAGGADVVGMNALDVLVIVPDRSPMDHISDTLLRWKAPGEIMPWLATSWKNVDPLTWELELRRGVKFQNGELFDA